MSINACFTKSYKGFKIKAKLEFGGIHGLLGVSGAGKSVSLACIAGIVRPDSGKIELDGKIIFESGKTFLPPQKRRAALIMQKPSLFTHLTARQNIELCSPCERAEAQEKAEKLIQLFKMSAFADKSAAVLSGGQAQRTAFARALASEPRCLLLDEPFSALDGLTKDELYAEILPHIKELNIPVLYVSHDLPELLSLCAEITVIENGTTSPPQSAEEFTRAPLTETGRRLLARIK